MNNFLTFIGQHWFLVTLLLFILLGIIVTEALRKKDSPTAISPQEAVQLMNRDNAIVVDIRKSDAFVRGHIIHAFHIPAQNLQKDIEKLIAHKHKPIILVCAQGAESAKVSQLINQNEFEQVMILKGGIQAWREANLPLEKGK